MAEFRLSTEAETELDGIWLRIAGESGSIEIAYPRSGRDHRAFLVAGAISLDWPQAR